MASAKIVRSSIGRLVKALDESGKTGADVHLPYTFVELVKAGCMRCPDGNFREGGHILIPKGGAKVTTKPPRPVLRTVPADELAAARKFRKEFFELGLCS